MTEKEKGLCMCTFYIFVHYYLIKFENFQIVLNGFETFVTTLHAYQLGQ